jgi:ElaB/YqjD/DUF883 family membrane-anchored ribosome-binding protein
MTRYKTPAALRHDAHTLAEDARGLLEATAELKDEKVAQARKRLNDALAAGKEAFARAQEKAGEGAQAVDEAIRRNPYQSMAIAFGAGALVALLLARRSKGD